MNTLKDPLQARPRRDLLLAAVSVAAGLAFAVVVWMRRGADPAQQYLAGYLIELSLSIDNVVVFALVFEQFGVEPARQRKLLFWGIAGAVVFRTVLLAAGVGAILRYSWLIPVFGAVLLAAGARLAARGPSRRAPDPSRGLVGFATRHAPAGLAALVVLEAADLIFALDSLPAVLAVTHDALIAVTSNLFAILGLRSLYFVVSRAMRRARFVGAGLSAVLCFVGAKMLIEPWVSIPTWASLAVIAGLLALTAAASSMKKAGTP